MPKKVFFDREIYLETLTKRVNGLLDGYHQNIALIGDELVGKTSLIFKFLDKFYDSRVILIYLEIRPEALPSFSKRFAGVLLYNFLLNSGIALQEDLDFLIRRAERYAPKTVQQIKHILEAAHKRKKNNILTDLFSLTDILHEETGKRCVVIMDEFHNLEGLGVKDLYREWSKLLIAQKNTMYIITSSLKFRARSILSKNLSLLFGNFELISLEPFDIKASSRFLDYKLSAPRLDPGLRDFIVHFTGGVPMYLDVISEALQKNSQNNMTDAIEGLLFDSTGMLNQRFSNYIKRFLDLPHSNDYLSILHLVASGRNKIKEIVQLLNKGKKELDLRVNYLLELDTLTRNGDFLKINDRVFGFWMRFVYQEKLRSLTFDAKNQKESFRQNLEALIREFLASAQRPIIERLTELLRLFADDSMQLEKKKIRLNHFREIKALEFNHKPLQSGLLGRSAESLWIMAIKDTALTEEDIAEFAKECRRYRHRLKKSIVVSLKDIDMNTRLRAMEEKIWAWDIKGLNQMFDLYSKPWVIA